MSLACAPVDPSQAMAERLAGYVDCHAQALGQAAFAGPALGWMGPALLTGCLTIYVALIGYRLLLRQPFGPREAVLAALRAGMVIAFATSWSAYETVVYRVVVDGPAEIAAEMLAPLGLGELSLPDIAQRVDADYLALQTQQPPPPSIPAPLPGQSATPPAPAPAATTAPPPAVQQDPIAGSRGLLLVVSAIGGLMAVRLVAAILLAIGPLVITLALFDVAVGVFEGWVRALAGALLASAAAMLVAALELDFFEAQLAQAANAADPSLAISGGALTAIALIFCAISLAVVIVSFGVGRGFRLPRARSMAAIGAADAAPRSIAEPIARSRAAPEPPEVARRAQGMANAVMRLGERERQWGAGVRPSFSLAGAASGGLGSAANDATPLGPSGSIPSPRRSITPSRTPSAGRRDMRK